MGKKSYCFLNYPKELRFYSRYNLRDHSKFNKLVALDSIQTKQQVSIPKRKFLS